MNKRNEMIVDWAINKIQKQYKGDVSLLLTYGSYENGTSNPLSDVDFYFIPKTDHAYELCKTFIVEGIGFDLFPMSWERVAGLAEINEFLTPCLANVKILYCDSEEDKIRFEELQNRLRENLNNKQFMLDKAFKQIEMGMDAYTTMIFEDDINEVRTLAGEMVMFLSDSVAYANQTYFKRGLKTQLEDIKNIGGIPNDFVLLYESVIKSISQSEIKKYCYKMIKNTKDFLSSKVEKSINEKKKTNYEELAGMYEEGISTWNKIYVCCDSGNAVLAYISGVCLQRELNVVSREYGLNKFDLMGAYSANKLEQFRNRAMDIQKEFVKIIEENGVNIEAYDTIEEFIIKN